MHIVTLSNTTRAKIPPVSFEHIARTILGRGYELSLVMCGDARSRSLNKKYRAKTYAANVLSFPLSKNEGEIFLNIHAAAREANTYNVSLRARLVLLFAHGCLHLKGYRHGKKMELLEPRMVKKFGT